MNTTKLVLLDAKPDYAGYLDVEITDESGATYKTFMKKEEYKLRSMLITLYETLGPLVTAELTDAIEDYAQVQYERGYDSCNFDNQ